MRKGKVGTLLETEGGGSMVVTGVLLAREGARVEILSPEIRSQKYTPPPPSPVPGLFLAGDVVGGTGEASEHSHRKRNEIGDDGREIPRWEMMGWKCSKCTGTMPWPGCLSPG